MAINMKKQIKIEFTGLVMFLPLGSMPTDQEVPRSILGSAVRLENYSNF